MPMRIPKVVIIWGSKLCVTYHHQEFWCLYFFIFITFLFPFIFHFEGKSAEISLFPFELLLLCTESPQRTERQRLLLDREVSAGKFHRINLKGINKIKMFLFWCMYHINKHHSEYLGHFVWKNQKERLNKVEVLGENSVNCVNTIKQL